MSITIWDDHLDFDIDGFRFYITEFKVLLDALFVVRSDIDKELLTKAIQIADGVQDAWTAYCRLNVWLSNVDYPKGVEAFADVFHQYPRDREYVSRLISEVDACPVWYVSFKTSWHDDIKKALDNPQPLYAGSGYVYLLEGKDGHYKIGKTVNPEVRIRSLGVVLPFEIKPIHLIECENHHKVEKELHWKYSEKRTAGEWYRLDPEDVEYIKGLAHIRENQGIA